MLIALIRAPSPSCAGVSSHRYCRVQQKNPAMAFLNQALSQISFNDAENWPINYAAVFYRKQIL